MSRIETVGALEALYGHAAGAAVDKVTPRLTDAYADWIARSRFCLLATAGPEGVDVSPRGEDGSVVRIESPDRLLLPDWPGNNRIDSLRNVVRDGRASLLFMVPGSDYVVRVNGRAHVETDADLLASFARKVTPRSVIVMEIDEVYFQCAKALLRSGLWHRDDAEGLPTAGEMVAAAAEQPVPAGG